MLTRKTLARLNERPKEINRLPFMVIGAVSLALGGALYILASSPLLALATLAAAVLGVLGAYMAQKARSTTSLSYDDLDGDLAARFASVGEACKDLSSSEKIRRLSDSSEQRKMSHPAQLQTPETPAYCGRYMQAWRRRVLTTPY